MTAIKRFLALTLLFFVSLPAATVQLLEPTKRGDRYTPIIHPMKKGVVTLQALPHNIECLIQSPELKNHPGFIGDLRDGSQLIIEIAEHNLKFAIEKKNLAEENKKIGDQNAALGNLFATQYGFLMGSIGMQAAISGCLYFFSHKLLTLMAVPVPQEKYPNVYTITKDLCTKAGLGNPEIYLLTMNMMNAAASGNRDHVTISLTQSFLDNLTDNEIEAVISHELGHTALNHVKERVLFGFFGGVVTSLALAPFQKSWADKTDFQKGMSTMSNTLLTLLGSTLAIVTKSRHQEKEADLFGAHLCKKPLALASALEKIESFNKEALNKTLLGKMATWELRPFTDFLRTHPHTDERSRYLKKWADDNKCTA